jgi:glycosyltransferase involved in cell wall biosynthesis
MKYAIASYGAYLFATKSSNISGGNDKQEWLLAKSLAARGHEVILLVPSSKPLAADVIDGVRMVRYPDKRPTLLYALWKLRQEKPDWFHVMGASPNLWISAVSSHLSGFSCAYALSHDMACDPHTALNRNRYLWRLYAMGLRSVDRILAQHVHQINLLAPDKRGKAYHMNNIIEEIPVTPAEKPFISWIGWLRRLKRPDLLIKIARALPHLNFVVCGPVMDFGPDMDYGREIVEEFKKVPNIDYRGYVNRDETQRIIAQSTLLLSTAVSEGFPNTFLEAWVSGVPVVSLEIDPGDIMAKYQTGLVLPSVEETIQALKDLHNEPERLESLGKSAYDYVHKFHSGDYVCKQLEDALGVAQPKK